MLRRRKLRFPEVLSFVESYPFLHLVVVVSLDLLSTKEKLDCTESIYQSERLYIHTLYMLPFHVMHYFTAINSLTL
jgi:hypothetical protein